MTTQSENKSVLVSSTGKDIYHVEGSRFFMTHKKYITPMNDNSVIDVTDEDPENIFFSMRIGADQKIYVHPETNEYSKLSTFMNQAETMNLLTQAVDLLQIDDAAEIVVTPRIKLSPVAMEQAFAANKVLYESVDTLNQTRQQASQQINKHTLG